MRTTEARKWGKKKGESKESKGREWRQKKEETDVIKWKKLRKVEQSFLSAILDKRIKKEERKERRIKIYSWKTSYILIPELEVRTSNTFLIINDKYKIISNQ